METSVKVSKLITQILSLHKEVTIRTLSKIIVEFYVLLTVHPIMILVNKQRDVQFFMYVYFYSLQFRAAMCPSSGELLYQCDRLVCRLICIPDGHLHRAV